VAIPGEHRREQRPAWLRLALVPVRVLGPVLVPVLLLMVVIWHSVARDAEPSGLGEPATGLVPGATTVTAWQQDESLLPAGFGPGDPGHVSPQALVDTMIADARRAPDAEPWIRGTIVPEGAGAADARVYLPLPEYPDAWVAAEWLLELTLKSDGWHVDEAHVRFHCRRAVRDSLCG
jgi:hypothetical protein